MPECDICGKRLPLSEMESAHRSGPPYYDWFCICKSCYIKSINKINKEANNGREGNSDSHHQQSE